MNLIQKAKVFATAAHAGQKRKHGSERPYIYHPEQVVKYLEEKFYNHPQLLAAAWCHDVIEDCQVFYNTLVEEFDYTTANLVQEVTQPIVDKKLNRSDRWEIYLNHYANASHFGKVLKLADRICNLREYRDFWEQVPRKVKNFLQQVYLEESGELLDYLRGTDQNIEQDLIYIMNELDELCSEED